MSLSDLASLGSFVSGVAVLASLVLLYIQLRQLRAQIAQSEVNQRAAINEAYTGRVSAMLQWLAEPANSRLVARVYQGDRKFNGEEVIRLSMVFRWNILHVQAVIQHHEAGLIDSAALESAQAALRRQWLPYVVYRVIWANQAETFGPGIRAFVERAILETPLAPEHVDVAAGFAADLARMMGEAAPSSADEGSRRGGRAMKPRVSG